MQRRNWEWNPFSSLLSFSGTGKVWNNSKYKQNLCTFCHSMSSFKINVVNFFGKHQNNEKMFVFLNYPHNENNT